MLVFIVTFVLLAIGQQYFFRNMKQPSPSAQEAAKQQQAQQSGATTAAPAQNTAQPAGGSAAAPTSAPAQAAAPVKQASAESDIVVENDVYKITFTNRGAQVKSWILKKYKDERGNPLELVHAIAAQQYGYPLSFYVWDAGLREKLNTALYVTDASGQVSVPGTLAFDYSDGDLVVRKRISFDQSYVLKIETEVRRGGVLQAALPAWPAGFGDATVLASYAGQSVDYSPTGEKIERLKTKNVSGGAVVQGPMSWGGAVDQYFAAIFLPENPQQSELVTLHNALEIPKDPAKPQGEKQKVSVLGAASGSIAGPTSVRLFAGPKAVDVLKSVQTANGGNLEHLVDLGWFSFIARPLFAWARWTQAHWIPNWGWAIIFMTLIINLALLPLRIASMRSALKMQKIAPQIKAVQEKYKKFKMNDPRRMDANKEISALYKEHGVNPAGGCLPMLIQMPFLFAFYAMLANAIELRQAKWLWLNDLATPDKYFILPILIVVTMLMMQRITPTAGMSPEQQRMMNVMMPLMVGLMSWSVASGLGLYWVTGTIVGIVQQMVMNRTELGREMRVIAERRNRK